MGYKEFELSEIDTSAVYIPLGELRERTGIKRSTMYLHIKKDHLNVVKFGNKTLVHPDEAERYAVLVQCGFLGTPKDNG